ncbi:hypothetical protein BDP27DRAFT_1432478 [Rhodocollybia butyracea]|uniref:Uncharacterized protein n=1 Tax=Rhodocollybia butyracea TaxID=206335 RepID=A0A9P5TXB9_9AGAR|nr:hypothetical protein BDP27DRAFT_1432478 [Rhodocollybia butyracea]
MPPIKILLALSWVLATFLTTIASPLIIPVNGNDAGMTRIEIRQALDRRVKSKPLSKPVAKREQPIKVPVQLWIAHKGKGDEHWALVIDSKNGFEAVISGNPTAYPLKPRKFFYNKELNQNLMDLGCQATFETREKMDDVFSKLEKIDMPTLAIKKGGNCMDYVRKALEVLEAGNHISKIPTTFEKLWESNYNEVQKRVWG